MHTLHAGQEHVAVNNSLSELRQDSAVFEGSDETPITVENIAEFGHALAQKMLATNVAGQALFATRGHDKMVA
jgi:hypothetical protein